MEPRAPTGFAPDASRARPSPYDGPGSVTRAPGQPHQPGNLYDHAGPERAG
jgi:hypothetical protein